LILTFLTFGALDYYLVMTKHQYAEHLMHKYLQRMAVEGRLAAADEAAMVNDFDSVSMEVEDITAPRESRGDARVLRGPNIDDSTVYLRVTLKPVPQPLWTGRLVGGNIGGAGFRIIVGGKMLSERVYP